MIKWRYRKLIFQKVSKDKIKECTEIIEEAFWGYDFFSIYAPDKEKKKLYHHIMMEIWVRDCFEKGTVLIARQEEKIVGVAVLQSPEDEEIEIINKEDLAYDHLEKVAGADNIEKFIHMCEVSDADCHKLPIPKWHLVLLAISNKCKGQGIGSIMLQKCIIPYLKEHNAKLITFNTNAEINRRFYIKNGFEEFAEKYLVENGIRMGNWSYKMSISD